MIKNLGEKITDEHYEKIARAMQLAFHDYIEMENIAISKCSSLRLKPRTKGSLIHDFLQVRIKQEFQDSTTEILIGEFNGIFGVLIRDIAFIRFKKLSNKFDTSNVQTVQTVNYNYQRLLDGFPLAPVKLYAGYLPNATWTGIDNIYLFCREGSQISWSMDLTHRIETQPSLFEVGAEEQEPKVEITIKPKEEERKTGTNNK